MTKTFKQIQEINWSISPEKQKEVNKFLVKSTGGSMHQDVNLVMKKFGLSKSKAQDMVFNWMSSWSPDKRLSAWGPKDMPEEVKEDFKQLEQSVHPVHGEIIIAKQIAKQMAGDMAGAIKKIEKMRKGMSDWPEIKAALRQANEEAPANATGSAVAGTGDDSSTVLVKRRKELQKRLLRRFSIKETLDKILPDPVEKEDVITTRKKQLKELAKNRNV